MANISDGCRSEYEEETENDGSGPKRLNFSQTLNDDVGDGGPAATASTSSHGAPRLIDDTIVNNPFVLKLMDRLATLEDCLKIKSAEAAAVSGNNTSGRVIVPEVVMTSPVQIAAMEVSENL